MELLAVYKYCHVFIYIKINLLVLVIYCTEIKKIGRLIELFINICRLPLNNKKYKYLITISKIY